jgi:hypothetical protein
MRRIPLFIAFAFTVMGVTLVLVAAAILVAAGGREQRLVPFYAVAVFASFLAATVGCAWLSYQERRWGPLTLNLLGSLLVGVVLAINATRIEGTIALLASAAVAAYLWRVWASRGRPTGLRVPVPGKARVARAIDEAPANTRLRK